MEYVDGHSLKDLISEEKLATAKVIGLAKQICEGLSKAHQAGIVHRDIKPENILINSEGLAKITDFGLAKVKGVSRLTREDSTLGTLNYMSPEQVSGEDVDHRSDIFSFGVVLYEMITGQLPFKGENDAAVFYSILNQEPDPLARYKTGVSEGLQRIVDKALDKDKETRYQNIADLLADLKKEKRLYRRGLQSTHEKQPDENRRRFSTRAATLVALGILFAFLASHVMYSRFFAPNRGPVDPSKSQAKEVVSTPVPDADQFVIAVAPFWGVDAEAMGVGKVMQALVERKVYEELGQEKNVKIVGKAVTEIPRSHEEAKELGERLEATILIWGDVLTTTRVAEIQPYLTIVKWPEIWKITTTLKAVDTLEELTTEPTQASLEAARDFVLSKATANETGKLALLAAGMYYHARDPDKAIGILEKIIPPSSESLRWQGNIYFQRKDWEKTIDAYDRAIQLDPKGRKSRKNLINVYHRLGWSLFWQKKFVEAEEMFLKAVGLNPSNPFSLNGLGWALFRQWKNAEAEKIFLKGLKLAPSDPAILNGLGALNICRKAYDAAERYYQRYSFFLRNGVKSN